MLALQNNAIVWVDEAMVRRELGADRGDLPGLGFSPRALRLAHLMQYQDHLADVQRADNRSGYPAATYFPALPPAGPLPPGAIDPGDFTQSFFPAEIDVDFTPIPDDELPALVEDALALQPIDLQSPAAALDSTAVMIVAPVPRAEWRAVMARLTTVTRPVKPAAPNLLAQRKPFEILLRLRLPRVVPTVDVTDPSDAEWQRLARLPSLWFVRRRQLALRDDYAGAWQPVAGVDERAVEGGLRVRLAGLGLGAQFDALVGRASPAAAGTLTNLLASPRYAESPALTAAAIGSLSEAARAQAAPAGTAGATAGGAAGAGGGGAGEGGGTWPTSRAAARAAQRQRRVARPGSGAQGRLAVRRGGRRRRHRTSRTRRRRRGDRRRGAAKAGQRRRMAQARRQCRSRVAGEPRQARPQGVRRCRPNRLRTGRRRRALPPMAQRRPAALRAS